MTATFRNAFASLLVGIATLVPLHAAAQAGATAPIPPERRSATSAMRPPARLSRMVEGRRSQNAEVAAVIAIAPYQAGGAALAPAS